MNNVKKVMYKGQKKVLLMLLSKLRLNYNLYVDDDKEVIDAINLLKEEVENNVMETEEPACML